jgi:hypothetical protein
MYYVFKSTCGINGWINVKAESQRGDLTPWPLNMKEVRLLGSLLTWLKACALCFCLAVSFPFV